MKYSLKDDGYPSHKWIMTGQKKVGTLYRKPDHFLAKIGAVTATHETEKGAFMLAVQAVGGEHGIKGAV
jgi:hypothetical protein